MGLATFCSKIAQIEGLSNAQKAVAILFFIDKHEPGVERTANELARTIKDHGIGNPNPNALAGQIRKTRCVYGKSGRFRLRQDKRAVVRSWVAIALDGAPDEITDGPSQFLSESMWKATRGYIEKVCLQLNGCYSHGYYDAGAVMVRRLVETLIIECYEHLNRDAEIKDGDGNYLMLKDLIECAIDAKRLTLGREAKKGLKEIKSIGDRAAHNRRYNARRSDFDGIRDGLRVTVEELINIADLYKSGS